MIYKLVVILIFHQNLFAIDQKLKFYGHIYNNLTFSKIQNVINCWGRQGYWHYDSNYENHRMIVTTCQATSSRQRFVDGICNNHSRRSLAYSWEISENHCYNEQYYKWSLKKMCKLLQGTNIMFVGDSIASEFYITFMSAMNYTNECSLSELIPVTCYLHNSISQFNVIYVRNDFLSNKTLRLPDSTESLWLDKIDSNNISLVVLNRGVHYKPHETVVHELRLLFQHLTDRYPNLSIIYRNTPYGHADTSILFNSLPLQSPQNFSEKKIKQQLKAGWHYDEFVEQNSRIEELIINEFPNIVYMDVVPSTILRADSHTPDPIPIHYCIPGPIDNFVRLFYNIMHIFKKYSKLI